jgi:DNA primase
MRQPCGARSPRSGSTTTSARGRRSGRDRGEAGTASAVSNRLIFPIYDVPGHIVGFGGRLLGDGAPNAPKYLNSAESDVFAKRKLLYGLNWAKQASKADRIGHR